MGCEDTADICTSKIELVGVRDAWENIGFSAKEAPATSMDYSGSGMAVLLSCWTLVTRIKQYSSGTAARFFLISVPNVREYYEKLIEYRSTVCK